MDQESNHYEKRDIMKSRYLNKTLVGLVLSAALVGCDGGGGGGSTFGPKTSPSVSANGFISALNSVDGASFPFESYMIKDQWDTVRSNETWFVIYDAEYNQDVAVSLQYLRSIVYYAHFSSNNNLAREFRDIQSDDQFFNGFIGDFHGNNYEVVVYDFTDVWGEDYYRGTRSGLLYEDEGSSFDVSMMAGEKEEIAFYQKAANVSFTYSLGIEASLALVNLGQKVEKSMGQSRGNITLEDQVAIMSELSSIAGVTLEDINKAAQNSQAKAELIEDIADRIGTTASNLEQRILPDLLGLDF
jgi:hypothetical protein